MVTVRYCGQAVTVTEEVAEFLKESARQIANSNRRYQRHNVPLMYTDPDTMLDTKRCTGCNYLVNKVIWNMQAESIRKYVHSLGPEQEKLYYMRYVLDMTQQKIAEELGVSKMAVSKRLKKLQGLMEREFFRSAQPEREQSRPGFLLYIFSMPGSCGSRR